MRPFSGTPPTRTFGQYRLFVTAWRAKQSQRLIERLARA
jgi:hypothetical protein